MTPATGYAKAALGALVIVVLATVSGIAPLLDLDNPSVQALHERLTPPTRDHALGQDALGRDILSRVVFGARVSLAVGIVAVTCSATIGLLLGALAGYRGGWTDLLIMRAVDVLLAFPGILLALSLTAVLGPSLRNVLIALTAMGWTGYARLVRAEVLSWREREFVTAARTLGGSGARVVTRHVLPQVLPPLLVQATFGMAGAIVGEASLSFLGLGVQPPTPSWGAMLNEARGFMLFAPHLIVAPSAAIVLTVLGFNLLGDGLQEALNVRRGSR